MTSIVDGVWGKPKPPPGEQQPPPEGGNENPPGEAGSTPGGSGNAPGGGGESSSQGGVQGGQEPPIPPSSPIHSPPPSPPPTFPEESSNNSCQSCSSGGGNDNSNEEPKPAGASHPLNQLDKDELRKAVKIIKAHAVSMRITEDLVFASVSLKEPLKSKLLPYLSGNGAKPPRKAWSVFSPNGVNSAYEITVNLNNQHVEEFTKLPPGTQPNFNNDDPIIIQEVVRNDKGVKERATKSGVTNMQHLICDAWTHGYNDTALDKQNKRLMDMYLYARKYDGDNQYAHPLDFLVTVDMISKEVIDIVDLPLCPGPNNQEQPQKRPVPPPQESHNYDPRVLPKNYYRDDVKPLEICQKKGPSFEIQGNKIKWQRWEMIVGFNFREALTLHNITFQDGNRKRGVLYRAAISEMVVPYGDPRIPFYRKSAFDAGEFGFGYNANSLTNGCDCLGEIRYMDFIYADSKGKPKVTKNAICIHEEDAGLLQKHTEFRNGNVTIARSRRLVISFIATVTNYDYACYWIFYQDGTMEMDIKATGLLSVHALGKGSDCGPGGYGTIVAPRINAPYHQHIFCARLDTMIDGQKNTVALQEVVPVKEPFGSKANPYGQGFTTKNTILEKASGTNTNADVVRSWLVTNENSLHPYTKAPVAWKLVTPGFCRILAGPESGIYKRAGFARHNVWVTPYNDEQLYAAGKYINQAPGNRDGVNIWAKENGNIRNTDIVLWHTFGLTHIPRVEDYSLMPVEGASFIFRPSNFFTANPALDVPQPVKNNCK